MIPNGVIASEFLKMRINHGRQKIAHEVFDSLRQMKIRSPNEPQRFVGLFAPTQSGKSTTVRSYIQTRIVDEAIRLGHFQKDMLREEIAEKQKIALHVTMEGKATSKSLASDILSAFGDPRASQGTTTSMLGRVYAYMKFYGTQILFLDEIQHLDHRLSMKGGCWSRAGLIESSAVTDTLKTMLLRGLVPIVFIGIEEASSMIFGDPQLSSRCLGTIDYSRLRPERPEDRKIFVEYCGMLGLKLKQHGIFDEPADLVTGDIPSCIHEVVSGRLGMVSNLVLAACTIAKERGANKLQREHLSAAVYEWAIPRGLIDYNPFELGINGYKRTVA